MRITHYVNLPARTVFEAALALLLSFDKQMSQCVAQKFMTAQASFRYAYQRSGYAEACIMSCLIKVAPRTEGTCELLIDADGFGAAQSMGNQQFFLADFTKRLEERL